MDKLTFVDEYLNYIKENTLDLIEKNYGKKQLLMAGLTKGKSILNGSITKQDLVDLCSIGIALAYQGKK